MSKKFLAIGGGENGRIKSDGTYYPFKTKQIDMEIINITVKNIPIFCF